MVIVIFGDLLLGMKEGLRKAATVLGLPPLRGLEPIGVDGAQVVCGRLGTRRKLVDPGPAGRIVEPEAGDCRPMAPRVRAGSEPGSREKLTHSLSKIGYRDVFFKDAPR